MSACMSARDLSYLIIDTDQRSHGGRCDVSKPSLGLFYSQHLKERHGAPQIALANALFDLSSLHLESDLGYG